MDVRRRAIGVFDSGIGGLTVLAALRRRLPAEQLIYLGDTARVPYGTRSREVIAKYAQNNARFLSGFELKMLVVACNTVSAVALPELERALPIPVLGVVEPGARAAAQLRPRHVGVIGTPGTIRSGAYQGALARLAPDARVSAMACPLFVPLAEEGWIGGDVPIQVARRYLASLAGVDTLVLGCTHYPVLREVIGAAMGPEVRLVDSTEATAEAAAAWLGRERIENEGSESGGERLFVTDLSDGFGAVAERFFGRPVQTPELVDIAF